MKNTPQALSSIFDAVLEIRLFGRSLTVSLLQIFWAAVTSILLMFFLSVANLKPEIGENFFFSSEDPQMRTEQQIQAIFPQDPQVVMGVKGAIRSESYYEKIRHLSEEIKQLPQVIGVQSLARGPANAEDAFASPLWSRVLISADEKSTLVLIFLKHSDSTEYVQDLEKIAKKYDGPDFQIMISGQPYMSEMLQRFLLKDLKIFSTAAFILFGLLLLIIFRSIKILIGMLLACAGASMLTLLLTQFAGIVTGPLTANLSTIVFVLTLSHVIFMSFNWKRITRESSNEEIHPAVSAAQLTLPASFWSMLTTLLGFMSLLMVQATPLRQLGAAGAIGAAVAFFTAYAVFPGFLKRPEKSSPQNQLDQVEDKIEPFFAKRHRVLVGIFLITIAATATGVFLVETDPSLFEYFKKGGEIRNGLEYLDQNGGSSPLFLVVQDLESGRLSGSQGLLKLWGLGKALEEHPDVGSAVSISFILAEAKQNFFARFLSMKWLIRALESDLFGSVAKYFISEDRTKALILLRMKESARTAPRMQVIEDLENIVRKEGLEPYLTGGVYSLQGRMSKLLTSSLISGLALLMALFVSMVLILSGGSIRAAFAMLVSLCAIPLGILGCLGFLRIPVDVVSSPAVNIAMGTGVDAMIHLLFYVRRYHTSAMGSWESWKQASLALWKPIVYSAIVMGVGFGIFALSSFPPTQRFGIMVVLGALIAPAAALISFVFLASIQFGPFRSK